MQYQTINSVVYALGRITASGVNLLGSTLLLNRPGIFVTAAHVTDKDDQNLVVVIKKYGSINDYQDTSDCQVQTLPVSIKALDPFSDICILESDTPAQSNIVIGGSDTAPPGSNVSVFGYPHADHGRLVLTHQRAEVGARILIESGGIKTKHLVLNTQARPGQSGSPIFSDTNGSLVGILIGSYAPGGGGGISLGGVDPHTLHQTTHAISSEYIEEML
jgi:hypothetical protein